ncbi:MAG: hypothetical protein MUO24_02335 [Desulfobacterales bacterium]|nr:hypothetical protein [Desulfobacterales bacterium]
MDKPEFHAKITEVAELLGMKVEDPGSNYLVLILVGKGERGGRFYARSWSNDRDKLMVSGEYPRFDGQSCSPKDERPVGISLAKTAAQIAHDIERRVLPTYRANLAIAWERFDAWTASRERREQMMQRIADEVGANYLLGDGRGCIFPPPPWREFIYKIEPRGDDQVTMEIEAPAELAIRILRVVKTHARVVQQSKEEG